jgi:hypothetical protein
VSIERRHARAGHGAGRLLYTSSAAAMVSSPHVCRCTCIKRFDRDGSETTIFVGVTLDPDAASGVSSGLTVPVARERAQGVREMLLSNAMGVRRT